MGVGEGEGKGEGEGESEDEGGIGNKVVCLRWTES